MEKLKVVFVKFYQGVNIDQVTNVTSAKTVSERNAQNPKTYKLEKTEHGVLITTEDQHGKVCVTEVPYNNVAYINYEPQLKDSEQKPSKASAMKPAASAAKASSESK